MQASTSPETFPQLFATSSYHPDLWTGETSEAVQFPQHVSQHQIQDNASRLFLQSQEGNTCEQQPELELPSSSVPNQQTKTSQRRETRREVACQRCRNLKVRCDTVQGNTSCRRCLQANRTCDMIQSRKKKLQKISKIKEKISDLQNQIQMLTQKLTDAEAEIADEDDHSNSGLNNLSPSIKFSHAEFPSYQTPMQYPNYAEDPSGLSSLPVAHAFEDHNTTRRKRMILNHESQLPNDHQPLVPAEVHMMTMAASTAPGPGQTGNGIPIPAYADLLRRYIPDSADAYRLFDQFTFSMAPQIPIVVFPKDTHPADIMATRPTLFLAILSIAAPLEIQAPFSSEFLRILGDSIIADQETSLELLQALQVIIVWFLPTGGRDARCLQYCSIACTMAVLLGMNIPSGKDEHWSLWSAKHPEESGEGARAYVGCFILGSMYVKRPLHLFAVLLSW